MLFHLPDSYDAFLNELTAKERRNVRRDERRLEQNGPVECNCIHEGAEAHAALSRFIDLHQRHWRSEGQLGHFRDWPAAEPFHRELAERMSRRGRLIILEVRVGGDLVASEYGYRFGRRLHLLLTSRAPGIPGRLSFCSLVGHAIDRGVKLIDAMRGYYEHKKYLGAVTAEQESVSILPDRNLSRCRVQAGRGVSRVIHGAYYRIWFARLAPRIPALQRPLWQKWIRTRI